MRFHLASTSPARLATLRAAGIELPPPSKPGPRARDPLHSALDRLSPAVRLRALAYLTGQATETAA